MVATEIIVALIGFAGVILAAIIGGFLSRRSKEKSEGENSTSLEKAKNKEPKKFYGDLTDFFENVTDRLDIHVAVKNDGTAALFYDYPLKVHVERIEYFLSKHSLVFLSEAGDRRQVGLPLREEITEHLRNKAGKESTILMIRLKKGTKTALNLFSVPLVVYD